MDRHLLLSGPGKQTLKIFDGNDALQRNHFRVITVPRHARSQEMLVRGSPCRALSWGALWHLAWPWLVSTSAPLRPPLPPQEAALRAYYVMEDPCDFELQALPPSVHTMDMGTRGRTRAGGSAEEEGSRGPGSREAAPEAWILRALPHTQEDLKIYPAWLK